MRSTCLALALGCSLGAQVPDHPTEAFFKGDSTQVMLACAERAASLKPRKERVLAQAGRAHLIAGDRVRAESYFLRTSRGDPDATRWIGQARLECGEAKAGLATLLAVAGEDSRAKNAKKDAAVLLMDFGMPKEAEEVMSGAFAMDPRDWENVMAYARACLRQKRQDLAAIWIARVMANRRKNEELWSDIALSLLDARSER